MPCRRSFANYTTLLTILHAAAQPRLQPHSHTRTARSQTSLPEIVVKVRLRNWTVKQDVIPLITGRKKSWACPFDRCRCGIAKKLHPKMLSMEWAEILDRFLYCRLCLGHFKERQRVNYPTQGHAQLIHICRENSKPSLFSHIKLNMYFIHFLLPTKRFPVSKLSPYCLAPWAVCVMKLDTRGRCESAGSVR